MKLKVVLVLTLLVLASLLSFSNRCKPECDGRTMIVMSAPHTAGIEQTTVDVTTVAESSPLLRIAVTL